jgi:hypothetical protein
VSIVQNLSMLMQLLVNKYRPIKPTHVIYFFKNFKANNKPDTYTCYHSLNPCMLYNLHKMLTHSVMHVYHSLMVNDIIAIQRHEYPKCIVRVTHLNYYVVDIL